MLEERYRQKLQRRLESVGGFVFRINDVAGTGIRYADLVWVYNGNVYFIECKLAKCKISNVFDIKQGTYATPAQVLANHIVQKANGVYLYAFYFPAENEERLLYFKTDEVYSYSTEREKKPTVVLFVDSLIEFTEVVKNYAKVTTREYFEKIFCEESETP